MCVFVCVCVCVCVCLISLFLFSFYLSSLFSIRCEICQTKLFPPKIQQMKNIFDDGYDEGEYDSEYDSEEDSYYEGGYAGGGAAANPLSHSYTSSGLTPHLNFTMGFKKNAAPQPPAPPRPLSEYKFATPVASSNDKAAVGAAPKVAAPPVPQQHEDKYVACDSCDNICNQHNSISLLNCAHNLCNACVGKQVAALPAGRTALGCPLPGCNLPLTSNELISSLDDVGMHRASTHIANTIIERLIGSLRCAVCTENTHTKCILTILASALLGFSDTPSRDDRERVAGTVAAVRILIILYFVFGIWVFSPFSFLLITFYCSFPPSQGSCAAPRAQSAKPRSA